MMRSFVLGWISLFVILGCSGSRRSQLEQAEEFSAYQRSQLARHLFIQVVKSSSRKDDLRARALQGLFAVSAYQLHQYQEAVEVIDLLLKDYENDPLYKDKAPVWRAQGAVIAREHLEDLGRAREYLLPLQEKENLPFEVVLELGQTAMATGAYSEAEEFLLKSWDFAQKNSLCAEMRSSQLSLIHVFQLGNRCDRSLEWAEKKLPAGCIPDALSILYEKAICYEMMGETVKAEDILESALKEQPENKRLAIHLQGLRNREKRKAIR